jgi:hypothetical protein
MSKRQLFIGSLTSALTMNRRHLFVGSMAGGLLVVGGLAGFALKARADGIPSNPLYYSGTLTEGGQLVNATRAITINIWPDGTTQGTPLCQTVASTASVVSGRFRIALSGACKTAINQNNNAYVEVLDGATSLGRSPIGAVPYAVEADHATNADNAIAATYASDAGYALNAANAANAANAVNATNASSAAVALAAPDAGLSAGLTLYSLSGSSVTMSSSPCAAISTLPQSGSVRCNCPPGSWVVSGGAYANTAGVFLRESEPMGPTQWAATCATATGDTMCVNYYVLCSRIAP